MMRKGRREPVGIGYVFEFYKSDLRYQRLFSFVPNFNTTSDENDVIDQSYLLLLKRIIDLLAILKRISSEQYLATFCRIFECVQQ